MLKLTLSHATLGERPIILSQEDLLGEGASIGRTSRSTVVLDDPVVSRIHARLTLRQGSVFLSDAGSTAGTALNGSRLSAEQPARLAEGDRIVIGPFTLTLSAADTGSEALRTTIRADPPPASYMPLAGTPAEAFARWHGGKLAVRVLRVITETREVKTFVLGSEVPTLFTYLPGQHLTLHLLIDGKPVVRPYSISSSPSRPHTLSVTVKRSPSDDGHPNSAVSAWMHDHLSPGDALAISGPFGGFSCVHHPSPRLLLASAGIGITPMLSMIRWLTDTASEVDVVFLHTARTCSDIICRRELELLASLNPRLRLAISTTRPETGASWIGLSGRLSRELLTLAAPDHLRRMVFSCGPEGFMHTLRELLTAGGFPSERLHEERFTLSAPSEQHTPGDSRGRRLTSRHTAPLPGDQIAGGTPP